MNFSQMRTALLISSTVIALILFIACNKDQVQPNHHHSETKSVTDASAKSLVLGKDQMLSTDLTLQDIIDDPYTHLVSPGSTYQFSMAGTWNYSNAYLLFHTGTSTFLGEVYQFNNSTDYISAGDDCDKKYSTQTTSEGTTICCDGTGTECRLGVAPSGLIAIIRCNN